jgi:hypothetical protein
MGEFFLGFELRASRLLSRHSYNLSHSASEMVEFFEFKLYLTKATENTKN